MKKIVSAILSFSIIAIACTNSNVNKDKIDDMNELEAKIDSLENINMKNQIATFLTFQDNNAENAMNFYVELFDNSKIVKLQRWGKDMPGEEGKIMHATFDLNGNLFMCSDSPPVHEWDFSPAVSNYIDCENEKEIERLFTKLSENGNVTMPLNNYGFSKKFGWVIDQFGISWQLNLQ